MLNRLAGSTSPYLLQHQHNPVDWYPWGEEALQKAVDEDKPIFLSIGYSACHWCHVMEHESFENPHIAAILNEHFVSIKVDREQRPDLDQIYMQVVQMLTGAGGWPMSVFLTPSTKPFYGGTYWPPENRWGRPGFATVLTSVADAWKNKRPAILEQSDELVGHLQKTIGNSSNTGSGRLDTVVATSILERADANLLEVFDPQYGGFGNAPKFPHATDLRLLMYRQSVAPHANRLDAIARTLDGMAAGGIYDHLGGGFARYSVDERWLVPHFEKMLYDNALLATAYLDGYRLTKNPNYASVVRESLDYILRDMTDPLGGFYSAEDADSEGEEGKFYVWSLREIIDVLGEESAMLFCETYGVTRSGNFEGHNILYLPQSIEVIADRMGQAIDEVRRELASSRRKLLDARSPRIRPLRDDKVLVSWNALMIAAMAESGVVLQEPRYLAAAQRCAEFLLSQLRTGDGGLLHVWRAGHAEIGAFLDDYAYLASALLSLWECDGNPRWLTESIALVDQLIVLFSDTEGSGFYFTSEKAEPLITRVKDSHDSSVPSGNSMAAWILQRLAGWMHRDDYRQRAQSTMEASLELMHRSPMAVGQLLLAVHEVTGANETWVVLVRESVHQAGQVRTWLKSIFAPDAKLLVVAVDSQGRPSQEAHPSIQSWLHDRYLSADQDAVLYLCQGTTCQAPVVGLDAIFKTLKSRGKNHGG
jgi:uncharacterized protein